MNGRTFAHAGLFTLGVFGGSVAMRIALPVAAIAQQQAPQSQDAVATGDMGEITATMERRLARDAARSVGNASADRAYVGAMSAITRATTALCKKEMAVGTDASVRATAAKILSVGQQQAQWLAEYEQRFHIDHSN